MLFTMSFSSLFRLDLSFLFFHQSSPISSNFARTRENLEFERSKREKMAIKKDVAGGRAEEELGERCNFRRASQWK